MRILIFELDDIIIPRMRPRLGVASTNLRATATRVIGAVVEDPLGSTLDMHDGAHDIYALCPLWLCWCKKTEPEFPKTVIIRTTGV